MLLTREENLLVWDDQMALFMRPELGWLQKEMIQLGLKGF